MCSPTWKARIRTAPCYVDADAAEDNAFADQIEGLPEGVYSELSGMRAEYRAQESRESIVARDADILECLIQAKEYVQQGHPAADRFTRNAGHLSTDSARKLWARAQATDVNEWWSRIGKFER
jgi:putative hydrolase of HD superfamily